MNRLVERDALIAQLRGAVDAAAASGGRVVLVSGEAGAGKTALVAALSESLGDPGSCSVRWGRCDNLRTARAFGPIADLGMSDPAWRTLAADGSTVGEVGVRLLELLREPAVVIIEDLHWADEATLEVIGFVGRRLESTRAVLVLTYRSDEVVDGHLAAVVIGELTTNRPLRITIPPLSIDGVAELAVGHHDAAVLHRRTGGNAFFVTECLASGAEVPESVRDAVLARAARLSPRARAVYDLVSLVPGSTETWLVDALGADGDGLDECVSSGVLIPDGDRVRFRHELARLVAVDAVAPMRRRAMHAEIIAALSRPPSGRMDHARLVHHAQAAGDVDAILRHAPEAAKAALSAGARVQAAAHLELAAGHAGAVENSVAVELWAQLAEVLADLGRNDEAITAYERAIELAAAIGDPALQGGLMARASSPLGAMGRTRESDEMARRAVHLLEPLGPTPALARALIQRCSGHMLSRELSEAAPWGARAIALAESLRLPDDLALAHIQSGVAAWMNGDEDGLTTLRSGIELAERAGSVKLVAFGVSQLGSGGGEVRRYDEAIPALRRCVELADREELPSAGLYARAWLGRCLLEQGRWNEASIELGEVLRSPRCIGISRMTALTAVGRLRARRGDPDVWIALDEALELARLTGHLQRLWPVAAARLEARWLEGDRVAIGDLQHDLDLAASQCEVAAGLAFPWALGELGFWLWRFGRSESVDGAAPFALHASGRIDEAAAEWDALGCPYESALAWADGEHPEELRSAFHTFESLGAAPARARSAHRMRELGVTVPRGPNAATKGNPAGLTDREIEVVRLVAMGMSNPEIAAALTISAKTAGHHVSHVLTKLGATSRAGAVAAATRAGVLLD